MTNVISTDAPTPAYVELDFTWTPATSVTLPDGNIVPGAAHNTTLTFTPVVTVTQNQDMAGPLTIVEHRWDFGDGVIGYGTAPTHSYNQIYSNARAALRVTDSKGRFWFAYHYMRLS